MRRHDTGLLDAMDALGCAEQPGWRECPAERVALEVTAPPPDVDAEELALFVDALVAVLWHGAEPDKRPLGEHTRRDASEHMAKARSHLVRAGTDGDGVDGESGSAHAMHAVARVLLALAR